MDTANTLATAKISATDPIKFRPGKLGPKIVALMDVLRLKEPSVELSATLRDGLEAVWPQFSAYLITRQLAALDPQKLAQLASITGVCAKALEYGITPDQLEAKVTELMETKLSA